MNRTLLITTAAVAAAFIQPVYAKPNDRGSGGGKAKAEARVDRGASAQVQRAPRAEMRSQAMPRVTKKESSTRSMRAAPTVQQREAIAKTRSFESQNRSFERRDRSFDNRRQSPTIAFGGSTTVDRNVNVERQRTIENRRDFDSSDSRRMRPPTEVWRNWDRRHIHTWNNHRYRWYNNDWVIVTDGFGYGHYPTDYYSSSYYDVPETSAIVTYSTTDGMASAVQSELARRGYNPGVIDGVIGPQTRSAIAAFQSDEGLPVTGRIDSALLDELNLD